jgi:ribonuclease-3
VAEELYARFPQLPEGRLTQLRARLVREESLAGVATGLGLAGLVHASASPLRPALLADALEAVFGAVFLDGGYDAARAAIVRAFGPLLDEIDPESPGKDAKTRLQELMQARGKRLPEYRVVATHGAAHEPSFEVECRLPDLDLAASGSGSSLQRAQQQAAGKLLAQLER